MEHACVAMADDKAIYISGGREHLGSQGIWTLRTSFLTLILTLSFTVALNSKLFSKPRFDNFLVTVLKKPFQKSHFTTLKFASGASNVYFQ